MKIEEQLAIARQSAVRHVSVAQNEMPSSVFLGVTARPRQYIGPVIQLRIIAVHEFSLTVVNCLAANVDVGARQKIKPELGFAPAHVGYRGALRPLIAATSARVNHFLILKIARLNGPAQFFECPRRHGQIGCVARNDFENAGLQDQFRIGAVNFRGVCFRRFQFVRQRWRAAFLAAPLIDSASGEFHAAVGQHTQVVPEVTVAGEQIHRRHRARQVIAQHFLGHAAVEPVIPGKRLRAKEHRPSEEHSSQ